METRQTTSTQGRLITFKKADNQYYTPGADKAILPCVRLKKVQVTYN